MLCLESKSKFKNNIDKINNYLIKMITLYIQKIKEVPDIISKFISKDVLIFVFSKNNIVYANKYFI
jgi:hypothetical protein